MELYFSEINISKCFNTHEALNNDKGISKHIKCIRQMIFILRDFHAVLNVTTKHKL